MVSCSPSSPFSSCSETDFSFLPQFRLYNDIFYSTTEEFRSAWEAGIEKIAINYSGDWVGTDRVGDLFPEDEKAPPFSIQPDGQRFGVDVANKYVEWMGESFSRRSAELLVFFTDVEVSSHRLLLLHHFHSRYWYEALRHQIQGR